MSRKFEKKKRWDTHLALTSVVTNEANASVGRGRREQGTTATGCRVFLPKARLFYDNGRGLYCYRWAQTF